MCLILVKRRGKPMPPAQTIEQAFTNNEDGFGLAYCHQASPHVTILKGAMTVDDAFDLIKLVPNPQEATILMHFRYATEGMISRGNCHPFPISRRTRDLQALVIDCEAALVHNGMVWLDFKDDQWEESCVGAYTLVQKHLNSKLSDTQRFIRDYLVGMGESLYNPQVQKLILTATCSVFAILTPSRVILLGHFLKDNGILYSNGSYHKADYCKPKTATTSEPPYTCDLCGKGCWYLHASEELGICWLCKSQIAPTSKIGGV